MRNPLAVLKPGKDAPGGEITPMQMLQVAVERGDAVENIEKLMDLNDRYLAARAKQAFDTAMAAFKKDPPELLKDTHVKYPNKGGGVTEYDHETLNVISIVIGKALAEHGLYHSWETTQEPSGLITVSCILGHELGHSKTVSLKAMPDVSGGKNPVQGVGSTVSYLERYTLKAIVGLAAAGQDDADSRGIGGADGRQAPTERPNRADYAETDLGETFNLIDEFGETIARLNDANAYLDAASKYLGKELSAATGAANMFHEHNQVVLDRVTGVIGNSRSNSKVASFFSLLNGKRGD